MATTSAPAPTTLRIQRELDATPERVFDAWTTPETMKRWSSPGDVKVAQAVADLRVGGAWRIDMSMPDGTVRPVGGVYREIQRPRRLVYTWKWQDSAGFPDSVVTLELEALPTGRTSLVLTHEGLPDAASREHHTHGWEGCLAKLPAVL